MPTGAGFCSVQCCDMNADDPQYCTNVSSGNENCAIGQWNESIQDYLPPFYCVIECQTNDDCPGSACEKVPGVELSICYGFLDKTL